MKRTITLILTFCIMFTSISVISVNAKKKVYSYNSKTKKLTISINYIYYALCYYSDLYCFLFLL